MNPEEKRNLHETKQAENKEKDKPANNNIHKKLTNYVVLIVATIGLFILIVLRIRCRHYSDYSTCPIQMGPELWLIVILALIIITVIIIIKDRK